MLHGIMQLFNTEYIDIQMMGSLIKVAIQNMYQIIGTLILIVSKRIRTDGLRIADAVQCIFIRQLGYGIQRSQQTVLFCTIGRVCPR